MTTLCLSTNSNNHFRGDAPPQVLYVATTNGATRLEREPGKAWRVTGSMLPGQHITALLHVPEAGGLYAASLPGTLQFSADGGRSWASRGAGIAEGGVYSLRYDARDGGTLYAGTQPVGLYRSSDQGRHWSSLDALRTAPMHERWMFPAPGHQPHLKTLALDPRNAQVAYAGVEQGALLKTTDGGRSWQDLDGWADYEHFVYKDVHQVLLRPSNPDEVFLTTGLGLFHSADAGQHWRKLTDSSFRVGYPDQLLFAPHDDRVLFMSGGFATPNFWIEKRSAAGTIMISHDGGTRWRAPQQGFPESRANVEAMSLCAHPGGFALFAGTTDGEVYSSEDQGESWARIASGLAPISKPTHDTLIAGVAY